MPKASKKKEKLADFKKVKTKLGKGKQAASNATDTSFKARSIALPSQKQLSRALVVQAQEEGDADATGGIPTTASGLTIDDVLVQLRHVNAGVRKESVNHLKEVLMAGVNRGVPFGERHGEVAKVVRGIGGLIADDDAVVRKALHDFVGWYLARLPKAALSPYLSLLQLQLSSALSHIFPPVRLDACKLVELLLETHAPDVVGTWPSKPPSTGGPAGIIPIGGSTIFEGLRLSAGLGEEKGASTQAGFRLTAASKLIILRAIKTFVARALDSELRDESGPVTVGPLEPKLGAFSIAELAVLPAGEQWTFGTHDWAMAWSTVEGEQRGRDLDDEGSMDELARTYLSLHPLLLATFMEAAPAAFSPSDASDEVSTNLCSVCAELEYIFARVLLPHPSLPNLPAATVSQLRSSLAEFLKRMTAWFPFTARSAPNPSAAAANAEASTLFSLSLHYAQLAVLLAPAVPPLPPTRREGWRTRVRAIETAWAAVPKTPASDGRKGSAAGANEAALRLAAEWVHDSLEPNDDALAPVLPASSFAALLPLIWSLLLRPPPKPVAASSKASHSAPWPDIATALLGATLRQASTSAKRRSSDAFLISIVKAHEDAHSSLPFFLPTASPARALLLNWAESAPRTLWELGSRDPAATAALLRFLLELGRRGPQGFEQPYSLVDGKTFAGVSAKLGPFFHMTHPTKGGVLGPWTKLEEKEQRLALDVARIWAAFDDGGRLGAAVRRAVSESSGEGGWAKQYWLRA